PAHPAAAPAAPPAPPAAPAVPAAPPLAVAAPAPPAPAPAPPAPGRTVAGLSTLRKLVTGLDGSRMCFGEPVESGGTTVIPVARVWAVGGAGFGHGDPGDAPADQGEAGGGGLGGSIESHPVGFITIAPDGSSRYEAIPDPQGRARAARLLASGAATLLTAVAASRALRGTPGRTPRLGRRRGARGAGLLPRGD
ncbi:spore germination protein GerW family protein, partial [Paraconexibacter algicola]|uniref:spore germination protein GerW family protein n=1 Tax=Paraconexibacter algicola TaxID=2133960 RepID=UPI0018EE8324